MQIDSHVFSQLRHVCLAFSLTCWCTVWKLSGFHTKQLYSYADVTFSNSVFLFPAIFSLGKMCSTSTLWNCAFFLWRFCQWSLWVNRQGKQRWAQPWCYLLGDSVVIAVTFLSSKSDLNTFFRSKYADGTLFLDVCWEGEGHAVMCSDLCWPPVLLPLTGKCFLYCNGLLDHIYVCRNRTSCTSWYKTQKQFSGTLVSTSTPAALFLR